MIIINVYAVIILNDGFPGNVASGQVDMYGLYAKSRTRKGSIEDHFLEVLGCDCNQC